MREEWDTDYGLAMSPSMGSPCTHPHPEIGCGCRGRVMRQRSDDDDLMASSLPFTGESGPSPLRRTDLRLVVVGQEEDPHALHLRDWPEVRMTGWDTGDSPALSGGSAYHRAEDSSRIVPPRTVRLHHGF